MVVMPAGYPSNPAMKKTAGVSARILQYSKYTIIRVRYGSHHYTIPIPS